MKINIHEVQTEIAVSTQGELFALLGEALIELGVVKPSFIQALTVREEHFPTGLPGAVCGIALPHTDPGHVIAPGMAIGVLKNAIPFTVMGSTDETVEVRVVFMLMLNDFDNQIDLLQRLMQVVQDDSLLEQLLQTKEPARIRELVGGAI